MSAVKFDGGAVEVDAAIVGKGLKIEASLVQPLIRSGKITCRHEVGEGDDAGRFRLSFFFGNRRLRLIVNETGSIIQQSAVDFGGLPLPASLRMRSE